MRRENHFSLFTKTFDVPIRKIRVEEHKRLKTSPVDVNVSLKEKNMLWKVNLSQILKIFLEINLINDGNVDECTSICDTFSRKCHYRRRILWNELLSESIKIDIENGEYFCNCFDPWTCLWKSHQNLSTSSVLIARRLSWRIWKKKITKQRGNDSA